MKKLLHVTILILLSFSSKAQFTPLSINDTTNAEPSSFTYYKGYTYFFANDLRDSSGLFYSYNLYKTNGLSVELIKDFDSIGMSTPPVIISISNAFNQKSMIVYKDMLYFMGYDSLVGLELFVSDGTSGGTHLFKDLNDSVLNITANGFNFVFPYSSYPNNFYIHNGELFFTAIDKKRGGELFKTNGTPGGTVLVKNINESESFTGSTISNFCSVGNTLFFTADDSVHAVELWKTDGTTAGTVLVKDIYEGYNSNYLFVNTSAPRNLTELNGLLLFIATDSLHGAELWKSDGTAIGTTMIKDVHPGGDTSTGSYIPNFSGIIELFKYKDEVYFQASADNINGRELWKTDGTNAGTVLVADLLPSTNAGGNQFGSEPFDFRLFKDKLLFKAVRLVYDPNVQGLTPKRIFVMYDKTLDLFINTPFTEPDLESSYYITNSLYLERPAIVGDKFYFQNYNNIYVSDGFTHTLLQSGENVKALYNSGNVVYASFNNTNLIPNNKLHAIGLGCTTNSLPFSNLSLVGNVSNQELFISASSCNLLARVQQTNNPTSVSGTISVSTSIFSGNTVMHGGDPLVSRGYEITPQANANIAQGIVTLYFTQQDFDNFNNQITNIDSLLPKNSADTNGIKRIRISKFSGISNDGSGTPASYTQGMIILDPIDSNVIWNASASRWEITILVNGFSGFFVGTSSIISGPLTTQINTLQVKVQDENVLYNYHFSNESDVSKYEVFHRSSEADSWEKINTIESIKSENSSIHYTKQSGNHYYIVHAILKNGAVQKTNIASCTIKEGIESNVYPNPANSEVHILLNESQKNKNITYQLFNQEGKRIKTGLINSKSNSINIATLPKGIYLLYLQNEPGIKIIKE